MIRKAETKDIKGIIDLLYQVDAVHHGIRPDLFKGNTPKYDEQALEAILSDGSKPIFVFDEGKILGHAFCQITEIKNHRLLQDTKTLYIDDICVDEHASPKDRHGNHSISKPITIIYESEFFVKQRDPRPSISNHPYQLDWYYSQSQLQRE